MRPLGLQRALITGAGRGLGKAMARRFASAGAEVVLTDVAEEPLNQARDELAEAGARCLAYPLDVTDDEAILRVRDQIHRDAGTVDLLRVWVLEPWIVKITPFLKHGLPTAVSDFLADVFGTNTSMDHWRGRDDSGSSP